jgi:hypothetical protein
MFNIRTNCYRGAHKQVFINGYRNFNDFHASVVEGGISVEDIASLFGYLLRQMSEDESLVSENLQLNILNFKIK